MFYGEEYNVPPCCDQKYFRYLFEFLGKEHLPGITREKLIKGLTPAEADHLLGHVSTLGWTTAMFMQSDYSLQQVLSKLMLDVPLSHLSLMVPELSETLIEQLSQAMVKKWYKGKGEYGHMVEKLTLVAPEEQVKEHMDFLKATLGQYAERVVVATAGVGATIIHAKNVAKEISFSGSTIQHVYTDRQHLTTLQASNNPDICREARTVIRLLSHHKIQLK